MQTMVTIAETQGLIFFTGSLMYSNEQHFTNSVALIYRLRPPGAKW